jgi:hypothetical protein
MDRAALRVVKTGDKPMNKKTFALATASAALALMTGTSALAADIATANTGYKNPSLSFVDRDKKGEFKDAVVEAGADPSVLQLHFANAQKVEFAGIGTLRITKANGSVWNYKPVVYQVVNGKRRPVTVAFRFIGKDRVSLRPQKVDASAPLVVGPVTGPNGNS